MKRVYVMIAVLLAGLLVMPMTRIHAQASPPVVRAVLFYSPACGHCHVVITETLPPLMEKYGSRLELIGVDVSQPNGQALFGAAMQKFGLEQAGVPFLAIDDMYLIGSLEIPEKLPGLIEMYLAQGGVDWPDIPGLRAAIAASSQAEAGTATSPAPGTESTASLSPLETADIFPAGSEYPVWRQNFSRDPVGNTLSVVTLAFMLGSAAWTAAIFRRGSGNSIKEGWAWIVPALCLLGFGAAGYLAYVETAELSAVCGPIGDCNTVQQSEYARLFGFLPIGVFGLLGYTAIFTAWLAARLAKGRAADLASISLFGLSAIGTMFSIYLTFLEPFVIGASCAWCLTSAVLMTVLMLLSVGPARAAFSRQPFRASLRRRRVRI
jgi:uncharacterized membrane protein